MSAEVAFWTADPPSDEVRSSLARLARLPEVTHIAVMPDVHLSHDVCIGTAFATRGALIPAAIGSDIGCGVSTMRFDGAAKAISDNAVAVMGALRDAVPVLRHKKRGTLPESLRDSPASRALEKASTRDGQLQFGTIGRGNHFVEFQTDFDGCLWITVHSGSRAMGPRVQRIHAQQGAGLSTLDPESDSGEAFLRDHEWAVEYARLNRAQITVATGAIVMRLFGFCPVDETLIDCTHNMVRHEPHQGQDVWVHRKGAISAHVGEAGIIPGSMAHPTFLVEGRGCTLALCSSSHGAGRSMSRTEARKRISVKQLRRETRGVHINEALERKLVEEAPGAYKPISRVMRAQRELTKVVGELKPVLNYKGA